MEQLIETTSRQAKAIEGRSAKGKVTGKLKTAIDAMLWQGMRRDEAATHAGLTHHSLREALKRDHVRQYYNQGIEVLRDNERARNVHRLAEIRDAGNNMPAVQAIGMLERMTNDGPKPGQGMQKLPGLVVVVNTIGGVQPQQLPHLVPAISHSDASD